MESGAEEKKDEHKKDQFLIDDAGCMTLSSLMSFKGTWIQSKFKPM